MSALLANATFRLHIYGTQAAHLPTNCLLSIPKVTVKCRLCQAFFHLFACFDPLQCFQLFQILTHSQKEKMKKQHQTSSNNNIMFVAPTSPIRYFPGRQVPLSLGHWRHVAGGVFGHTKLDQGSRWKRHPLGASSVEMIDETRPCTQRNYCECNGKFNESSNSLKIDTIIIDTISAQLGCVFGRWLQLVSEWYAQTFFLCADESFLLLCVFLLRVEFPCERKTDCFCGCLLKI